jgi:hypothetical protein
MVQRGYQSWREFNNRFAEQQHAIRALSPGLASWDDLRRFLEDQVGAVAVDGFHAHRFIESDAEGRPVATDVPVPVLKLADGTHYLTQEHDGIPITGPDGVPVSPLGLNTPAVAGYLRQVALSSATTGAAHLRWQGGKPPAPAGAMTGVLVLMRQAVRADGARWIEQGATLHVYRVDESGDWGEWLGEGRKSALRGLLGAVQRREPAPDGPLHEALVRCEAERIQELRIPSPDERDSGQRHAVVPLLAAIVTN